MILICPINKNKNWLFGNYFLQIGERRISFFHMFVVCRIKKKAKKKQKVIRILRNGSSVKLDVKSETPMNIHNNVYRVNGFYNHY